jgi:hypothetical protein
MDFFFCHLATWTKSWTKLYALLPGWQLFHHQIQISANRAEGLDSAQACTIVRVAEVGVVLRSRAQIDT